MNSSNLFIVILWGCFSQTDYVNLSIEEEYVTVDFGGSVDSLPRHHSFSLEKLSCQILVQLDTDYEPQYISSLHYPAEGSSKFNKMSILGGKVANITGGQEFI